MSTTSGPDDDQLVGADEPFGADELVCAEWVLTVDAQQRVLDGAAVVIDDGRIVEVGDPVQLAERHRPRVRTELPGHALLPGFVNAHTHLAMTMFRGVADELDLSGFLARLLPAEAEVLDADTVAVGTAAAAAESLRGGVTTALDMYFFPDAGIAAGARLGLRVLSGPVVLDGPGPDGIAAQDRLDWADRWLAEHPSRPGWRPVISPHSTYLVSPERLAVVRELAAAHGALVHLHAAETAAEVHDVRQRHGARPVELLDRLGLLDQDVVVAHGVHLDDAELVRVASSRAHVAHCPASNLKLAAGLARVPELLDAGASVALGTDGPASSNDLDMFTAMRLCALVHKGTSGDATAVPARAALAMATIGGARAVGLHAELGSIEAGKLADLVAVDLDTVHAQPVYDPVSALVYAAGRSDVRHVWVGGERVLDDAAIVGADLAELTGQLAALRDRVRATF